MNGPPTNLAGRSKSRPRGCLYVDETKAPGWLYIGVLAVADDHALELMQSLEEDRAATGYDRELHFRGITTVQKYELASRWLARVRQPCPPRICFHLLGINRANINRSAFGNHGQREDNLYRRALRMALKHAAKAYFPDDGFIRGIFHDARNLGADEYFDWHTPWRLRSEGLRIATDQVVLVDSNHANSSLPAASSAIQLIDLVLGVTRVCLDATTRKEYQVRLAREWLPFIECLTTARRRWAGNGQYGHIGRCSVGFFPSLPLTAADLSDPETRARSGFYTERSLALATQEALTLW